MNKSTNPTNHENHENHDLDNQVTAAEPAIETTAHDGRPVSNDGIPVVTSAQRCEVGGVRSRNEDSCLVFVSESGGHFQMRPFGLYVVADGMGGHTEGHIASKTASRVFTQYMLDKLYLPLLQDRAILIGSKVLEMMEDAVHTAHAAVFQPEPDKNGGTTLTAALLLGKELFIAHVGDSRAYLYCDGELRTLTNDHSLVRRMQDRGQLAADEASRYQYRHILLRALGQEDALEVDTFALTLPAAGKLLLCSDGLSGFVPEPVLLEIMREDRPPKQLVDTLYESAMTAGGYDNITAIVVDFRC
jgi:protein phosphatase